MFTRSRAGQGLSSWPVLLCFALGVLLPSAALLWFMSMAMANERVAITQRLVESYRAQVPFLQSEVAHFWLNLSNQAALLPTRSSPHEMFATVIGSNLADGAAVLSPGGEVLYPNQPPPSPSPVATSPEWLAASAMEGLGHLRQAADQFRQIAEAHPETHVRGPALLALGRCLQRDHQTNSALEVLHQLRHPEFSQTVDFSGRLLQPNAELAILELTNPSSIEFKAAAASLADRLQSYSGPPMASSQRRFLMGALHQLTGITFPQYEPEQLSADFLFHHPVPKPGLHATPDGASIALNTGALLLVYRSETVRSNLLAVLQPRLPAELTLSILPPRSDPPQGAIAAAPLNPQMPGWRLGLHLNEPHSLDRITNDQVSAILWTGVLVLIAVTVLAVTAAHLITRQLRVTRLKNDLVASVTHELKTPLASTRLLVDTLLAQENPDPTTTRDYLQLISRENARLTTLVQNFLTFSRMERNRHAFQFQSLDPTEVAQAAVDTLRERLSLNPAEFQFEMTSNLPPIMGDADSLITALINLLDNAVKYSGERRDIRLRVFVADSRVVFEVQDKGIGIPPREKRKIFRRFYRGKQATDGAQTGTGLGLSIVDYIVRAHQGRIEVQSTPGGGSTFRILLPIPMATWIPETPERACA